MLQDWGQEKSGVLFADSSAALAIAKRKGAGKLRHIHVSALWIQERQDREDTVYQKIMGTENPTVLMTKYLVREKMDGLTAKLSQVRLDGRAASGLELQGAKPAPSPQAV